MGVSQACIGRCFMLPHCVQCAYEFVAVPRQAGAQCRRRCWARRMRSLHHPLQSSRAPAAWANRRCKHVSTQNLCITNKQTNTQKCSRKAGCHMQNTRGSVYMHCVLVSYAEHTRERLHSTPRGQHTTRGGQGQREMQLRLCMMCYALVAPIAAKHQYPLRV